MSKIIIIYLVGINLIGYWIMGFDKKRAIKKKYRIPEKTLFAIAILGGSLGSIIGMNTFRHKTKHWYFKYGMPLMLIGQIILISYLTKVLLNI